MQLILANLCAIAAILWIIALVFNWTNNRLRNWEAILYSATAIFFMFLTYHHCILWVVWAP